MRGAPVREAAELDAAQEGQLASLAAQASLYVCVYRCAVLYRCIVCIVALCMFVSWYCLLIVVYIRCVICIMCYDLK